MALYLVRFCNDLCDSTGHQWHVCQRMLEIEARGQGQAITEAISEFEKAEEVSHWRHRARTIECELTNPRLSGL